MAFERKVARNEIRNEVGNKHLREEWHKHQIESYGFKGIISRRLKKRGVKFGR